MKYATHGNFIAKLRVILLGAGTQGISQHDLNQKSRTKIFTREHMLEILEEWENRGWVQKFVSTGMSKHPKIIWRATTDLRDKWSSLQIEGNLPTGPSPRSAAENQQEEDFPSVL